MTDFMIDALELLPQPAALFELPDLRYVASNTAAHNRYRPKPGEPEFTAEDVLRRLGLKTSLISSLVPTGTFTKYTEVGVVHMSLMPGRKDTGRPDLLLATSHEGVDEQAAWLDHNRMLLSLRVNENGEVALRMLEATLTQVSAALSAQRESLQMYNQRVRAWMHQTNPPANFDTPGS